MAYVFSFILASFLAALAWIDLKTFRLPDILTLPLTALGILQAWVLGTDWEASLIGAIIGYAGFVALETGFRHLRGKEGLGRGDAKLLAAGGAWCGWMGLPFIVLIASGFGLLAALLPSVRKSAENGRIPFGPFLALGIFMVWASARYVQATG